MLGNFHQFSSVTVSALGRIWFRFNVMRINLQTYSCMYMYLAVSIIFQVSLSLLQEKCGFHLLS